MHARLGGDVAGRFFRFSHALERHRGPPLVSLRRDRALRLVSQNHRRSVRAVATTHALRVRRAERCGAPAGLRAHDESDVGGARQGQRRQGCGGAQKSKGHGPPQDRLFRGGRRRRVRSLKCVGLQETLHLPRLRQGVVLSVVVCPRRRDQGRAAAAARRRDADHGRALRRHWKGRCHAARGLRARDGRPECHVRRWHRMLRRGAQTEQEGRAACARRSVRSGRLVARDRRLVHGQVPREENGKEGAAAGGEDGRAVVCGAERQGPRLSVSGARRAESGDDDSLPRRARRREHVPAGEFGVRRRRLAENHPRGPRREIERHAVLASLRLFDVFGSRQKTGSRRPGRSRESRRLRGLFARRVHRAGLRGRDRLEDGRDPAEIARRSDGLRVRGRARRDGHADGRRRRRRASGGIDERRQRHRRQPALPQGSRPVGSEGGALGLGGKGQSSEDRQVKNDRPAGLRGLSFQVHAARRRPAPARPRRRPVRRADAPRLLERDGAAPRRRG
mmetsp:Transcript_4330/g.13512  ORF Transcript_4330/g.13512 Transcript_4330/m.13512 type:complete len:506 (-) Transcript_4330:2611-4128(-)